MTVRPTKRAQSSSKLVRGFATYALIDLGKQVQEIKECVWPTVRMYFFSTMTLLCQRITINVLLIPIVWWGVIGLLAELSLRLLCRVPPLSVTSGTLKE